MDSNKKVIRDFFKNFERQVVDEKFGKTVGDVVLGELQTFAQDLVYRAIQEREKNPQKHDFTGNLLNSIVSAVYKDKELKKAYFSGESGLKSPRYYEMTASHGRYHFKIDYEGKTSNYTPDVETLRRKGLDDAYEFVSTYTPDISGYVIVVAYTTEYADWVENQRATTGFLATKRYAEKCAMRMFPLRS